MGELSSQKLGGYILAGTTHTDALLQPEPSRQRGAACCPLCLPKWGVCFPTDLPLARKVTKLSWELELERLLWRRRPGERDRRRTEDLRLGERHLLLIRGRDLRHMGGGGSILLGRLNLLGGGLGQGASTAVAVISWPSICPPSMCFSAFSASSGFSNSTYA
uniref:Uncharacterized protein n=1 Tax=Aotus nancymaae TaxID=37293 RepID=A0A2K5E318_AOTNA